MLVIYKGSNQWSRNLKMQVILAAVGTAQEMQLPHVKSSFQWSVSLPDGHPAWGENYGGTNTLREAQLAAEDFMKRYDIK